jgi:hypothetical protein
MRLLATALLVLFVACIGPFAVHPASAGSLLTETFTYPDGDLTANATWSVFSGTPPTDIKVVSGRAVGTGANIPDDQTQFTPQLTTAKTYYCFGVTISDPGGAPKAVYFAMLKDATTSNFVARCYVLPLTAGGWTFGLSSSSTNTTLATITPWSTTSLNYGQEYRIVVNYDAPNHAATMWVDANSEADPSITSVNTAIPSNPVQSFCLRQSGSASTFIPNAVFNAGAVNWTYSVDNLGVGTSMVDACDVITPVDHTTWGRVKTIYR